MIYLYKLPIQSEMRFFICTAAARLYRVATLENAIIPRDKNRAGAGVANDRDYRHSAVTALAGCVICGRFTGRQLADKSEAGAKRAECTACTAAARLYRVATQ